MRSRKRIRDHQCSESSDLDDLSCEDDIRERKHEALEPKKKKPKLYTKITMDAPLTTDLFNREELTRPIRQETAKRLTKIRVIKGINYTEEEEEKAMEDKERIRKWIPEIENLLVTIATASETKRKAKRLKKPKYKIQAQKAIERVNEQIDEMDIALQSDITYGKEINTITKELIINIGTLLNAPTIQLILMRAEIELTEQTKESIRPFKHETYWFKKDENNIEIIWEGALLQMKNLRNERPNHTTLEAISKAILKIRKNIEWRTEESFERLKDNLRKDPNKTENLKRLGGMYTLWTALTEEQGSEIATILGRREAEIDDLMINNPILSGIAENVKGNLKLVKRTDICKKVVTLINEIYRTLRDFRVMALCSL